MEPSLFERWGEVVDRSKSNLALVVDGDHYTFGRLNDDVNDATRLLTTHGLESGECVLVASAHPATLAALLIACASSNCTVVIADPSSTQSAIAELAATLSARAVVSGSGDWLVDETVSSKRRETAEVLRSVRARVIYTTSGSSGSPKLVVHSEDSLTAALDAFEVLRQSYGGSVGDESRYVSVSPLAGFMIGGQVTLLRSLMTGQTLVTRTAFRMSEAVEDVKTYGAFTLNLAPTMGELLLRINVGNAFDQLTVIGMGGSMVPAALTRRLRDRFAVLIAIGYGLTETCGPIAATSPLEPLEDSIGTVGYPLPGVEVAIDSPDHGASGEIICSTPTLAAGYWAGAGTPVVPLTHDGWFPTGDIGSLDSMGRLRVEGRADARLTRGGRKVYPEEIEATINSMPGVLESCVFATDAFAASDRIAAAVVVESRDLSSRAIRLWCRTHLASYMVPERVVIVDDLARSPDGKIRRAAVRDSLALTSSGASR